MAFEPVATIYKDNGKKKSSGGNFIASIIIAAVFLYFYNEFLGWFSEETGGPARHVENQDR